MIVTREWKTREDFEAPTRDRHVAAGSEGVTLVPEPPPAKDSGEYPFAVEKRACLFDRFCIPLRNDFLTSLEPGEPEHGTMSYQYDGYLWWQDEATPPLPRFSLHTSRKDDMYGPVDVTDLHLGAGPSPGVVRAQLATSTPNLERFEAAFDDGEWSPCEGEFDWRLHPGENRLGARAVNALGRSGAPAQAVVRVRGLGAGNRSPSRAALGRRSRVDPRLRRGGMRTEPRSRRRSASG